MSPKFPCATSWVRELSPSLFYEGGGGIKFVILVEDSDTGGPSSITLRMEYLFALKFWCCELSLGNQWRGRGGEGGQEALLLIFVIWRCFDRRWMRVGGAVQKVWFVFSLLVLLKEMRTRGQSNPFHCFHSFRNLPKSQKLWKKSSKSMPTKILMTWTSVTSPKTRHQPRHPLPKNPTNYIRHTNHSTRSPFLHTTQLQRKTTPKRRI